MKKILLVNTNIEKAPYPVPPVGLCLLASALEGNYTVKVYDGVFDEGKSIIGLVEDYVPDYIGFSIRNIDDVVAGRTIFYIDRIISDFIEPVKRITSVPIILGGSGFSMFPAELMKLTGADYGIIGEGENTFPELLMRLEQGKKISGLPNVISKNKLQPEDTANSGFLRISSHRFSEIDRHIDFSPYLQKGVYSVQTKRGCSHGCVYCTYPLIEGKKFRRRTPEDIADELEQAQTRLGNITFEFVDSTFNDPKGHAEAICREIIKRKLKLRLRTMGINPRNCSEELFELMKEAGFTQIDATPDSASPSVLKQLNKGFDLPEIQKMALLIKKFDLPTMWFFLFSGPGETRDTFRETIDFIDNYVSPDDLVYMNAGLRVYPGTPLYSIALKEGLIMPGQSILQPSVYYFSEDCGHEEINQLIRDAAKTRPNCLPSTETTPSPEIIREAIALRTEKGLTEPMFRTLLRIRKKAMWLLMIFLSYFSIQVYGQVKQDSLLRVLSSSRNDTNRVNILNELSRTFRNIDYTKALAYGKEGLVLSEKINYKKGIGASLRNIGLSYYRQHEYEKSREFLDRSYKILEELHDSDGIANYFSSVGDIYFQQQNYGLAIKYYTKTRELFLKTGNQAGLTHSLSSIGYTFQFQEKYDKAMEYYLKALGEAEKSGNRKEIANCFINVANVLNAQSDYKTAIQYLFKSLSIFKASGDKYNMGVCYNNMAANYIDLDSLGQAMNYLGKALQLYFELDDKRGEATCYLNMGIVSDKSKEFKKAIDYYLSALKMNEVLKDKYRITTCLANLTISYLNLREYDAVVKSSERGLEIAKEINVFDVHRIFYKSLSATYDSLGNYKKAYEYYKLYKQVDDSIFNAEKRKQVLELEAKYNSEKKGNEIVNLTKDNKLQAIRLENNRNFQIFLVVISFLVLVLFIVFYRLYKLKLNTSRLLIQKNNELESLNRTLSDSESALKELNATKDKFFTIIAHDIKNPLSAYRSVTKMLTNSFYELSEQQKLEYIRGINKSSENLFDLFQNLLQWATSQAGSMPFNPKEIDMGIIVFKAVSFLQESAEKKSIHFEMNVETDTYAYGDINMVSTVMVNLLSNAIKYTGSDGFVSVNATDSGNYLKISVIDNGIGITKDDLEKLFRVDIDHKTIGSSEEKGTGIGLILCKEFVSRNGGNIWAESEYGKGSAFHFTLPKLPG